MRASLPAVLRRTWTQVALAAVAVLGLALVGSLTWLPPLLAADPGEPGSAAWASLSAGILAAQFAYWQLSAAVLAVVLAILFGKTALDQLEHARQARADDRRAERTRALVALLYELHHNRQVLRILLGELRLPRYLARRTTWRFQRSVLSGLAAGPAWSVEGIEDVWSAIDRAYWEVQVVDVMRQPDIPWQAWLGGGVAATAWAARGVRPRDLDRVGVVGVGVGLACAAVDVVWAELRASRSERTKQARWSVEAAMDLLHRTLTGLPMDWSTWEAQTAEDLLAGAPRWRLRASTRVQSHVSPRSALA